MCYNYIFIFILNHINYNIAAIRSINNNEKRLTQNTDDLYAINNKKTLKTADEADTQNRHKYTVNKWTIKSGCHFSCIDKSKGIQIIVSNIDHSTNIQLCEPDVIVSIL